MKKILFRNGRPNFESGNLNQNMNKIGLPVFSSLDSTASNRTRYPPGNYSTCILILGKNSF